MAAGQSSRELIRGVLEVGFEAHGAGFVGEVERGGVEEGSFSEEGFEVDGHGCGDLFFVSCFYLYSLGVICVRWVVEIVDTNAEMSLEMKG